MRRIGIYQTLAPITFWLIVSFALVVLIQAGSRLVADTAITWLAKVGYVLGVLATTTAIATVELGGPEMAPYVVERSWAVWVLIAGSVVGGITIYYATHDRQSQVSPDAAIPRARALP